VAEHRSHDHEPMFRFFDFTDLRERRYARPRLYVSTCELGHGYATEAARCGVRPVQNASFHLEIELAANDVNDLAADPDVFAVLAQMDAADALEGRALRCDIRRLGESCTDEPLREARI
jgi:hypothetical protein